MTGTLGILTSRPGCRRDHVHGRRREHSTRVRVRNRIGSLDPDGDDFASAAYRMDRSPLIKDFVPLASLNDIVFGAWDPIPDDALTLRGKGRRPRRARTLLACGGFSRQHSPDARGVRQSATSRASTARTSRRGRPSATSLSKLATGHSRLQGASTSWIASSPSGVRSTEIFIKPGPQHATRRAIRESDGAERRSHCSAPCSTRGLRIMEGVPYCNGAPNLAVDTQALIHLANERGVPISGKDFKTGQTWLKTVIAPGFLVKARMLGLGRLVLDQHPRQSRRRSAGRPGRRSRPRRNRSSASSIRSCSPRSYPTLYSRISRTSCGSTTTRRGATTRKGGTTSISSGGWDTRCRSK